MKRDYTLYFETLEFAWHIFRSRQLIATYLDVQDLPKSSHYLSQFSVESKCNDGYFRIETVSY